MIKTISLLVFTFFVSGINAQDSASSLYLQAKQYDSLENKEKAIEYYSKAIAEDSGLINAYFNRGSNYAELKEYQRALNDFRNFDKASPNDHEVQYLLAACYYYLGNRDNAFVFVNKSLVIKPDFYDAIKLRATIYMQQGSFELALGDFNSALLFRADDFDIYHMSGYCYENLKDTMNALKNYLKAEELNSFNEELNLNIGNIFCNQGNYNQALIYFGKAISANANFALAYYDQGIAYDKLGFRNAALTNWKKAKDLGFKGFDKEILKLVNEK